MKNCRNCSPKTPSQISPSSPTNMHSVSPRPTSSSNPPISQIWILPPGRSTSATSPPRPSSQCWKPYTGTSWWPTPACNFRTCWWWSTSWTWTICVKTSRGSFCSWTRPTPNNNPSSPSTSSNSPSKTTSSKNKSVNCTSRINWPPSTPTKTTCNSLNSHPTTSTNSSSNILKFRETRRIKLSIAYLRTTSTGRVFALPSISSTLNSTLSKKYGRISIIKLPTGLLPWPRPTPPTPPEPRLSWTIWPSSEETQSWDCFTSALSPPST